MKLLPQGPNAVRAPWALDGFPDNDWRATLAVQESQLLHDRARELLSRVAAAGGCIMLENPPGSMTFQDSKMQAWIKAEAPFCAQVAACMHGSALQKRWAFVSNRPEVAKLASTCAHGPKAHESFLGKRLPDGSYKSRLTAEYPASLADAIADFMAPFVTSQGRCVPIAAWQGLLPEKVPWPQGCLRVEDGGGLQSSAFWMRPLGRDLLHGLRLAWTQRLLSSGLGRVIPSKLELGTDLCPLADTEVEPFLQDLCCFLGDSGWSRQDLLQVSPGQPFRLNLLQALLEKIQDPEASMCADLRAGVRIGVGYELAPSPHWPVRQSDSLEEDLQICHGSWKSASDQPTQVLSLLEEELREGWIVEYPSVEAVKAAFPKVAFGKLGLVLAEGRSPRLVVDSSISGVTSSCVIPNRLLNPRISDLQACAPISLASEE